MGRFWMCWDAAGLGIRIAPMVPRKVEGRLLNYQESRRLWEGPALQL